MQLHASFQAQRLYVTGKSQARQALPLTGAHVEPLSLRRLANHILDARWAANVSLELLNGLNQLDHLQKSGATNTAPPTG
jgi:hypothetical protein